VRIAVIGTGHVGLVAAATFAHLGHEVVATDVDEEKLELLSRGVAPFFEPGLDEMLRRQSSIGRLTLTRTIAEAVPGANAAFICVGTPPKASGEANLIAVERAAAEVAKHADDGLVLIQKSTVPVGTAAQVARALWLENGGSHRNLEIVSNPEFLREGSAIQDSLHPDRILVGAKSPRAFDIMRRIYQPLIDDGCEYIETDVPTAELSKHASNAFLALKISFVNALARICESSGADVEDVARVMGADTRIGRAFLDPGLGYGGYCLPKDVQAFEHLARRLGYDFGLLREVARINDEAIDATLEKVRDGLWNVEDKTVALLGLAFKPGTDDIRFAPPLVLARRLLEEGARVVGYDPQASANAKDELPDILIASDAYEAAAGAHCLVTCTEWPEFADIDLARVRDAMTYPFIVDGRNILEPARAAAAGFRYLATGRPRISG
jgi:UDPglucose 6-dehydrogenase